MRVLLLFAALIVSSVHSSRSQTKEQPSDAELFQCSCNPPGPVRLAYLINVHDERTMNDAMPLLNAVSAPNNVVLVHVDKKFEMENWIGSKVERTISSCQCGVREIHSVAECKWGKWSMNEPVLWAFDYLTFTLRSTFDKFVTLSGDSLPTLKNVEMGRVIEKCLNGRNVLTSVWGETGFMPTLSTYFPEGWHKRTAYSHPIELDYQENGITKRTSVPIHFGSQWMMLEPDFVYYIGESMRDENSLANSLKRAYIEQRRVVTDETFFPSLLMKDDRFNSTLPTAPKGEGIQIQGCEWLKTVRYERMDEHAPSAFGELPKKQRYKAVEGIEPRVWGPYFLGIYDLKSIKDSGALFIRKVSKMVEPNIYKVFPTDTRDDVEALPNIDWGEDGAVYEITPPPEFPWYKKAQGKKESRKGGEL